MCADTGSCVEIACIGVTCPANERCAGGTCVGACDGIVCPHNQQCIAGRCADLCDILVCGTGEVCVDGACVAQCPCNPCPAGQTCLADGSCESAGCDVRICDPGTYCEDGACLDACAGAVCPRGEQCELGECVPIPVVDAGVPPPPPPPIDAGGGGGGEDAGVPLEDAGFDAGRARRVPRAGSSDCGCDVPRAQGGTAAWLAALALLGVVVRRRRGSR